MQKHQIEQSRTYKAKRKISLDDWLCAGELENISRANGWHESSVCRVDPQLARERAKFISAATRVAMESAHPGSTRFGLVFMATWQRLAREAGLYRQQSNNANGSTETSATNGSSEVLATPPTSAGLVNNTNPAVSEWPVACASRLALREQTPRHSVENLTGRMEADCRVTAFHRIAARKSL